MVVALIIIGIVVVIGLFIMFTYNRLVGLKQRLKNAWAQIDVQLKRRFDLIPNLVETVKGYAAHEQETLEKVISARNMYANSDSIKGKAEADNMLTDTLKSIFALSENYPDLKANENFGKLQTELTGTEDKIAFSRQFYNDTVQMYNNAIMVFPSNFVANMFNFKEEDFFEAAATEKEPVKVEF